MVSFVKPSCRPRLTLTLCNRMQRLTGPAARPTTGEDVGLNIQPKKQVAMTRIGLIGCGMWGRNLARNLAALGVLTGVADRHLTHAKKFADEFGTAHSDVDELLASRDLDGVVIATAAPTHAELACRALECGLHAYVEKPFALTLAEAERMSAAATKAGRQLMVGHLIRYHDAFLELQSQVEAGVIGEVHHVSANRLAMGRIRATESVIHDLCPHDVSLILAIMGEGPERVSCSGASHVTPGNVDTLSSFLAFSGGRSAAMTTSWMSPYKEHRLTVSGSKGAIVFDDTRPWAEKLTLYRDIITPDGDNFAIARAKPVNLPVAEAEPLKQEMQAFVTSCETNTPALTGLDDAMAVQSVIEAMTKNFTEFGTAGDNRHAARERA